MRPCGMPASGVRGVDGVDTARPHVCCALVSSRAQALVAFTEAAGERTNERGALSGEQQSKFAGKFLEDIEADQSSEIGDVLSKMEAALGDEVPADTKPEAEAEEKKQTSSDGW